MNPLRAFLFAIFRPLFAKSMHRPVLLLIWGMIFGSVLTGGWLYLASTKAQTGSGSESSGITTLFTEPPVSESAFISQVLTETNRRRAEAGIGSLRESEDLSSSAMIKLNHMSRHQYWAHTAPDGTSPWSFLKKVGYDYTFAAENLAKDFQTADGVVNGWMESQSHREVMLDPAYTEIGIGVRYRTSGYIGMNGTWMVVAHYATRR